MDGRASNAGELIEEATCKDLTSALLGVQSANGLARTHRDAEIVKDFPDLTREDIRACLAFAAARERRLTNSVA